MAFLIAADEMTDTNAYLDGDIIAIGKDMLENGQHIKKLVHETTHFTEGSQEWVQVADFVFGKDASKVKTNLAKEISAVLNGGYGITQADVDAVVEHIASGYETKLTAKQGELIEEVVANRMENMFGDSESIERICREKPSLAKRIWERIKALIDSLGQSSSEREEIKKLRETERLFRAALENGGQDYIRGEIKEKIQFSKKVTSNGDKFVFIEQSSIDALIECPGDSLQAKVRNYMKRFRGTVLPLGSTDGAYMRREAEGEYTNPAKAVSDDAYNDKLKAASELENLLSCANYLRHNPDNGRHPDAVRGWNYYEIKYVIPTENGNARAYKGEIQIKLIARGDCFYDITKIEDITNGSAGQALIKAASSVSTSSDTIISQNPEKSTPELKKSKKIQHSYKGEHAEDADHGLLAQARELEADGVSSEDIWQQTGWFRSYDGKWRYEIDDSKMEFIGAEVGKETTLGKVIRHDELFKAYPQLKDVRFKLEELKNKDGQYDFTNNILTLSPSLLQNGKLIPKAKSLLIHEIQHAIQHIEGFARGGSVDVYKSKLLKERTRRLSIVAGASETVLKKIEKEFGDYGLEITRDYLDLLENSDPSEDYFNDLAEIEAELKDEGLYDLVSKYVKNKFATAEEIQKISKDAWDQYEKTAGEIEAYDVGKRVDFTSEQRKNTRPDVDQDKVFFADDSHLNSVSEGKVEEPVTSINEEKMQVSEEDSSNEDTSTGLQTYQQYSETLKKQFYEWLKGKMPSNDCFDLGETPPIMVKLGAPKLPLILPADRILKFTTDYGHEISLDDAADLPVELFDPVFLFKGSVEGSFVAVTDIYDKSGDQVIVAIHPNKWQKRMRVNRVASLYGKYNIENYVENNIDNGNLLDISIEKAPNWFTNRGLQLPKLVQTILDANNSISQNSEKSTPELKKSKKIQHSYSDKNMSQRTEAEEKELYYASLLRTSENLLNVEKGKFFSASIYNGNTLKKIPGILRSALRNAREVTGGIRKSLLTVKEWYNSPENGMLFKKNDDNELAAADGQILFDEDVSAFLEEICEGEGALNLDELKKLDKIGSYFLKVAERYKRVYIDGKWVDAEKIAEKKVSAMDSAYANQTFITKGLQNKYLRQFGEPANLCRCADGYDEDGFWTWWFDAMREANVNIEVDSMNALRSYREWHQTHKKWGDHLEKDTVTFRDQKIPIQIAMTLYCSLKTRKSQQGLADSGYEWREGKKNKVRKNNGLIEKKDPTNKKSKLNNRKAVEDACKFAEKELWEMFSEADRQYIEMFENILNEECRKWKIDTDNQMRGFSLVSEDGEYYFPTVRAQVKKTVSTSNYEGDRVAHLSSNKNVVEGARGSLLLEPIDAVVLRHIRNQLLYKHYAIVAENVSMLMNINVGNNVHNPVTLKTMIEKGGKSSQELLRMMEKLSKDLQGTPSGEKAEQRFIYEMIEFMRSGYAKYQLGANPKTLFSQLSSLIAACNILDFTSLARGMKGFVNSETAHEVDKYCPIAELRNTDNVAAKAQGVIDKTGKVGDFLMKGIGFVDRRVVCALFNACQIQVEKDSGLKLGTEENKVEAGKLLSKVILETQQNTFVTERSDAMRGGVLIRSLTMFSADSMKTTARWLDAIGEVSVLKRRIKNTTDEKEIKALEADLKRANGQLVRSSAVIVSQAVYMALLALAFRLLYNKEEEPEEEMKNVGADIFGNMLGGLPLLRDIYSYFSDGYEMENFMLSTINDVLIASKKSIDIAASAMKGEAVSKQEVASSIKNIFYSAGQVLGIPVRNVYNFSTGITRRFFPEAGYKVDDYFYKQSYNADLSKAIEKGDEDMVETITGLILDESIGGVKDKGVRSQITKLSQKGYSVLPRSVGDTLTYDGEEIALTKKQQNRFKELYSAANEGAAKLVGSSLYNRADEEAKAKAIKFLYDTYYNLALQEVLDVDLESKNVLFAEAIDIEDLAIIYSIASGIEADKDRKGNVISGSRKAKIEKYVESLRMSSAEKYLVMGYLGYKCKNGADKVKAYVSRLNLTKDEKARLMEYCGYAA